MNYFTDQDHPNVRDNPNGLSVYWSENHHEQIEVLAWTNYSSNTGEYNATLARFSVDEDTKILTLERVSIKRKYSAWDDFLTNPGRYVSDKMKRTVRDFISKEKGSEYWRVRLFKA